MYWILEYDNIKIALKFIPQIFFQITKISYKKYMI